MSAKNCQLCGKPLGRMRSSDGEFCSPEHRNQFRLRRGMDRLEEANKMASLMRRRDNPRQLSSAVLAAAGAMEPRGSSASVPFPVRQAEPQFPSSKPALFQVRIAKTSESLCDLFSSLSHRSSAAANSHCTPASLPFVSRPAGSPVLGPGESTKPQAGVARAGLVSIPNRVPAVAGEPKSSGAALQAVRRITLPQHRSDVQAGNAAALEKTRSLKSLALSAAASPGGESRTYPGAEFAKRPAVVRERRHAPIESGSLLHSRLRRFTEPDPREIPINGRFCAIPRGEAPLRLPRLRVNNPTATRQAAPAAFHRKAYDTAVRDPRFSVVKWDTAPSLNLPSLRLDVLRVALPGSRNLMSPDSPANSAFESRPAEVRFSPAESGFEHSPMTLQGGFAAPGKDTAQNQADIIEEHFDSGLDQWMGDLVEWKLDAAGARPAGLALLRPTLALSDYEFEFFTRIESRAVTFAFRAANVSNYFKVTISMVESGRYELKRCAVIGGIEEPPASSPLPGVLRPGSAFTVKTRAAQNDFSIWLDGELAARWTDGRLPAGGIGFMAPRDDRARVYWVRLSQFDGTHSLAASHRPVRSIQ